jgi:hypothetical protein
MISSDLSKFYNNFNGWNAEFLAKRLKNICQFKFSFKFEQTFQYKIKMIKKKL